MPAQGKSRNSSGRRGAAPGKAARATPASTRKAPVRRAKMTDKQSTGNGAGDQNVDQIRDILFGGQMRDYERRFQELSQRLEQEAVRIRAEVEKRFATIEKRFDEHVEKLTRTLRQESGDRAAAVADLEARNLQALRTARSELGASLDRLSQELESAAEREREGISELEASVREATQRAEAMLVSARDELRGEKVGRENLAALFSELALRLKGDFELPRRE